MKVPVLWLKDYLDTKKSPASLAASFTQLGLMLDTPLNQTNVLDLEHRLDRSDWLSITGCARDLAAFEGLKLQLPKLSHKTLPPPAQLIPITVHTQAVRRFNTRIFRGVTVQPSPAWMQDRLRAYGITPKNNLVDITNFVMVEYGQPLHAQDLAKLPAPEITLRPAKAGESLTTILGTNIKLDPSVFILASGGKPIVIGGIVGGATTSITDTTTDIILDAGSYDQRVIRRTSRRLKILNETVMRYDKFLDPRLTEVALARATALILELAGGTSYANVDYYPHPVSPQTQTLRLSRLALLAGQIISKTQAKSTLQALGYCVVEETSDTLTVEVPVFRTDVEVEDDLVADILRIGNYQNLPSLPLITAVPPEITPPLYRFSEQLRDLMVAQGSHEHLTNSLTKATGDSSEVTLANALSADQNALRMSAVVALTDILKHYAKHGIEVSSVFEIGLTFRLVNKEPVEQRTLSVVSMKPIKDILATLLTSLGLQSYTLDPQGNILLGQLILGSYQEQAFTLDLTHLFAHTQTSPQIITSFTHPHKLDLSLIAEPPITYFQISQLLQSLKVHYQTVVCKAVTALPNQTINYLLTFTWPEKSTHVESDKKAILSQLKAKLGIQSKS